MTLLGVRTTVTISREDWDTIVELGLGEQKDKVVLKKIATATKAALTRRYNSQDHPIPFHKAQDLGKVPKKLAGGPAPDLEEPLDVILLSVTGSFNIGESYPVIRLMMPVRNHREGKGRQKGQEMIAIF
jgi:hypothetical protein